MQDNKQQKPKRRFDFMFIIIFILLAVGIFFLVRGLTQKSYKNLTKDEFENRVADGVIKGEVSAEPIENNDGLYYITGSYVDTSSGKTISYRVVVTSDGLNEIDTLSNVHIKITPLSANVWLSILISLLPTVIFCVIMILIFRALLRSQGGAGGAMDFGKSTANLVRSKTVTFNDVAGCEEEKQELVEVVDFLKNPRKYSEIGARIPKGIILFGPPGTGKTLLAKAVAGEAGVPFFSISGSDFVEMFVGVGASRVRDMFKTAKNNAPCIIFIDEIDAVGRQRGAGLGGGHDEREQTLNQLLVEMDGFNNNTGVIVMAATNRPDVLDPALLRPGRFDRQITISNPDVKGREAILKVHARNKHVDPNIKLDEIAARTPGFSGADLENLLNEAALLAARENRKIINIHDIDEATDRVMMGPAKKSRVISQKEKITIAHHEAGHAVIGLKLDNANIVQKVTIIPRGQAGGYALMLPEEDRYLETKQSLLDEITGFLGGRVSEEINFGEISTGASNDFEKATMIARSMVTEYGMSDLGPIQYEKAGGSVFLGRDYMKEKNFSDQIALEIDKEVRKIIESCYERAKSILTENLSLVKTIADYLIKVETLTKSDIDEINETGHLAWYDNKINAKKLAEEAEALAKEDTKAVEDNKDNDSTNDLKEETKQEINEDIKADDLVKEEKSNEDNSDTSEEKAE